MLHRRAQISCILFFLGSGHKSTSKTRGILGQQLSSWLRIPVDGWPGRNCSFVGSDLQAIVNNFAQDFSPTQVINTCYSGRTNFGNVSSEKFTKTKRQLAQVELWVESQKEKLCTFCRIEWKGRMSACVPLKHFHLRTSKGMLQLQNALRIAIPLAIQFAVLPMWWNCFFGVFKRDRRV